MSDTGKRRLYLGPLTDNRRWDMVTLRTDDVIVVAPPKCGTTWMQAIVALLLSGDPEIAPEPTDQMPWVDIRVREISEVATRIEAMSHRRCLKSHTPMDGLPLDDHAQYICVFRHPLDAHFSYRAHLRNIPMPFFGLWYPKNDPDGVTFRRFLDGGAEGFDGDAMPLAHILRHYQAARAVAHRPNVHLFHYADMKRDLAGSFDRVAAVLGVSFPSEVMSKLQKAATFDHMKAHAERYAPAGGKGVMKSDADFFHSGIHGQWRGKLTDPELAGYNAVMDEHLTPADKAWLEHGATGGEGA